MSISITPNYSNIESYSYGATTLFNAVTTGGTSGSVTIQGNASAFVSVDTSGNSNAIFKLQGTADGTKWWTLRGLDYESGLIDGQFQGDRSIHYNLSGIYQLRGILSGSPLSSTTIKLRYQSSEVSIGSPQVAISNLVDVTGEVGVFGEPFAGGHRLNPNSDGSILVGDGTDLLAINSDGSLNITDNGGSITVDGSVSNAADSIATSSTNIGANSYLYGYDGTNWDRLRVDSNYNLNTRLQLSPISTTWFTGATGVTNGAGFYAGNNNYIAVRITPTAFTGTMQFQWSIDNITWNSLNLTSSTGVAWPGPGTATPTSTPAIVGASSVVLMYHGTIPPNAYIRVNISAYTTGSVTIGGAFTIQNQMLPTSTLGQGIRVQLANGTSELVSFGADTVTSSTILGAGMYGINSAGSADRLRTASIGDSGASTGLLGAAQYLSNGATQFNRARDMAGVTTDTTLGGGIQAVGLVGFEGTSYARIRTVNGVADGATTGLLAGGQYGWNGAGWDKQRSNNAHKYQEYLSLTNGQHLEIWTPAAGKKFRLMNVLFSSNYATGARVTLRDSVGGTTTGAANLATFNFNAKDTASFQFGPNGYLSYQANNRLAVFNDSGATVSVWLTFIGTEE